MRFLFLCMLLLLLVAVSFGPGCTGLFSGQPEPTPVQYTDLSQLAITRDEVPFPIVFSIGKSGSGSELGELGGTGVDKAYVQLYADSESDSKTTKALIQFITEVPGGNVSLVYDAFAAKARTGFAAGSVSIPLPDPGIGDQSMAFAGARFAGTPKSPGTVVLFRKGNIIEMIYLMSTPPDVDAVTKIAKRAAARIPTGTGSAAYTLPVTAMTTEPAITPVVGAPSYTTLPSLSLTRADMPFTVVIERTEPLSLSSLSAPEDFGVIRGFQTVFSDGTLSGTRSTAVVQIIYEYPPGNASLAYVMMFNTVRKPQSASTSVTLLSDPHIGDQSFAAVTEDKSSGSSTNPLTLVVFTKSNILEAVMVSSRSADITVATDLARRAEVKMSGTTPAAAPGGSAAAAGGISYSEVQSAGTALALSGPVKVTLDEENSVSKIAFSLQLPPKSSPVDMGRCEYAVITQKGFWSVDANSPDVSTAWTVNRQRNTLLEDGELLKVDMDTGSLDISGKSGGTNAFTLEVKPAYGTPLLKTCTPPAGITTGGSFECS